MLFSQSPHVKSSNTTRKIMLNVAIALIPACVAGIVFFGLKALAVILVSIISSLGAEILYEVIMGKKLKEVIDALDYSSLVTGIIIALILPATWHLYIPALASIFAIIVVKMLFGGTGKNLVNPAVTGRIFAFISFTTVMNLFVAPNIGAIDETIISGATSLQSFLSDGSSLTPLDLLLGTGVAGCIGETCKIAIIIGAVYLAIKDIIDITLPIVSLLVVGLLTVALNDFEFATFAPAILSGGVMFGAFFMATDYVTNPTTKLGQYVFFIGFGVLTAVLRHFSGYETTSFAILIMNLLVPLIDKVTIGKPFGYKRQKGVK